MVAAGVPIGLVVLAADGGGTALLLLAIISILITCAGLAVGFARLASSDPPRVQTRGETAGTREANVRDARSNAASCSHVGVFERGERRATHLRHLGGHWRHQRGADRRRGPVREGRAE